MDHSENSEHHGHQHANPIKNTRKDIIPVTVPENQANSFPAADEPPTTQYQPFALSPSAIAVAHASRKAQLPHRWPSFALDVSTTNVNNPNTVFMFADQIQTDINDDSLRHTEGPAMRPRVPINILKLPWQHPFNSHESNRNPYKIPRLLFAVLFLTTTLALFSAWDAQKHCISNETDALMALLGETSEEHPSQEQEVQDEEADAISTSEMLAVKATCRQMFRNVMLPVGLVTGIGSLLALGILRQHQQSFGKSAARSKTAGAPLMATSTPCFYSFYLPLLFVSTLILVAWTYGIILVMLRPRSNNTDNPYTSLAAVDAMGRVADNANLYYLSWISEGLAILIFYQLGGAFARQHWHPMISAPATVGIQAPITSDPSTLSAASSTYFPWQKRAPGISSKSSTDNSVLQFPSGSSMHAIFPATTHRYHSFRIRWFQTFYKLRVRTGIWVAALLSSSVVVASSTHLFHEVLLPVAQSLYDNDDVVSTDDQHSWWNIMEENKAYGRVCVLLASQDTTLSEEMCYRTFLSLVSGFVSLILCGTAIVLHLLNRRSVAADALYLEACGGVYHDLSHQILVKKNHLFPLRSELLLSVVLSIWLGFNALWVSSVQGPALRVGNLYYASFLSFFLCLRISLGCVEEYFNIDDNDEHPPEYQASPRRHQSKPDHSMAETVAYKAPNLQREPEGKSSAPGEQHSEQAAQEHLGLPTTRSFFGDAIEKERAKRLRRYFFLGAFSTVCAGSALDAANSEGLALTVSKRYMIIAPTTVAVLSAVLFLLCLSKQTYEIVSQFWVGGFLALVSFWIWLMNLILTMHSEDSWAVNGVGEIEMANLYYFSWASIITAGLQMTSFFQEALGLKSEDYMTVVWAAIGKVSFVILGAAGHIWHTISDQCDIIEIQNSAITYCSRTILAMIVAATGMAISFVVFCTRVLVPTRYISPRSRAHCEAVTSIFLMLLFGVAAAMITSIGSPGQSVGDLYYSVWVAFWVSIGIFVSCYDQIKLEEIESKLSQDSGAGEWT